MLLLSFYSYGFPFFIITVAAYYFFLKDDYKIWKKYRSFEGMKSEELVELVGQLRLNRIMMMLELLAGVIFMGVFMSLMIDVLHIKLPIFLVIPLIPLYLISLQIYVIKRRIRKSIKIFKTTKRTAS